MHYAKPNMMEKLKYLFNIRLNNHRKDVNNPKSIPADLHFKTPGHLLNLDAKFVLIEQLNNIYAIKKLEKLTLKGLNQELNNV